MMLVFQMKTSNLHHSAKLVVAVIDWIVDPQSSAPFCITPLLWPHHGQNVVPRPWLREWQHASSQPKPWEDSLVHLFLLSTLVFLTSPYTPRGWSKKDEIHVSRSPRQPAHLQQGAELQQLLRSEAEPLSCTQHTSGEPQITQRHVRNDKCWFSQRVWGVVCYTAIANQFNGKTGMEAQAVWPNNTSNLYCFPRSLLKWRNGL